MFWCGCSGGVPGGPGPDADPHHRGGGSGRPGADRPHRLSDRPEEEPRRVPDHLSGPERTAGRRN